jgi:hypothetical protein
MDDERGGGGPTVVSMPQQKNEMAAAGENLRRNLDVLIENGRTMAKIRRASYLAYVAEGFTEEQALILCCK